MTALVYVSLSLLAVIFTQLRADKIASEREAQLIRGRDRDRAAAEIAESVDQRRLAYVSFLSQFHRQVDSQKRPDLGTSQSNRGDRWNELYEAFAQVRVYGTQAAADDAEKMLEWLVASDDTGAADVRAPVAEAFVEHARQHLRLLAS